MPEGDQFISIQRYPEHVSCTHCLFWEQIDIYFFDFIKFGLLSINNEASCCALFEGLRLKIVIMTGESMEKVVDSFCFFSLVR